PLQIYDNDTAFSFSGPTYSVLESVTNVVVTVTRIGGTNFASSVAVAVNGGTASNSVDYSFTGVTLGFSPGQITNSFSVAVIDDLLIEGNETVSLTLLNAVNAVLGNQPVSILTLVDNDIGVGFISTNYVVNEKATNAIITLARHGAATNSVSVTIITANGTATAGQDYAAVNQTVTWGNGDLANKTILIPIAADGVVEGGETVNLSLTNVTGGAFIELGLAVLTIVDDAGNISFASANYSANEIDGFASVQLIRTGGSNGIVSVQYSSNGGTASAGVDYTNTSGTVAFGNGEIVKTVLIPIINDSTVEGPETINLILSNPGGAALLGSPTNATLTIVDDEVDIRATGASLVSESIVPTNNVMEAGETVTVQLALRNLGSINTATLVATLQTNSGVSPVTVSRNYGAVLGGGSSVSQPFTFVVNGTNGSVIAVQLKLKDGATDLGTVSFNFGVGITANLFGNATAITINDNASASPYPSAINVSGISGVVSKVTATFNNFTHSFPHDVQAMLVGPAGQSCVLMANCGIGANGITLTFDDAAVGSVPTNQVLVSGTYKPTRNGFTTFPTNNTPAGPYGSVLSLFNGTNPNGTWLLYLYDSAVGGAGVIAGGWNLSISSSNIVTSSADVGVAVSDSPDPVVVGGSLTYTVSVNNYGPGIADNIIVTNRLPAGVAFVSASRVVTNNNGIVTCNIGTLTNGGNVIFTISAKAPNVLGNMTNVTSVVASQNDANSGNNSVSIKTSVINIPPVAFSVKGNNFVITWPAAASNFVLEYATTLSPPNWQAYSGGYTVANGENSVSVQVSTSGSLFYRLRLVP
ncbi:MAG: Calx-beta domain protein, partial [Verrucomicrobiales bacterium]|nr:Calx-beta domain protein [Verrucomicrobiales bacterium]